MTGILQKPGTDIVLISDAEHWSGAEIKIVETMLKIPLCFVPLEYSLSQELPIFH